VGGQKHFWGACRPNKERRRHTSPRKIIKEEGARIKMIKHRRDGKSDKKKNIQKKRQKKRRGKKGCSGERGKKGKKKRGGGKHSN